MYKFLLKLFGYEQYNVFDVDLMHRNGKLFAGCNVYTGEVSDWENTKELAYRRGKFNPDHSLAVGVVTPHIRVEVNKRKVIEVKAYYTGIRKKK